MRIWLGIRSRTSPPGSAGTFCLKQPVWFGQNGRVMAMKHPSLKCAADKKLREVLSGYACPVPFHAVRTRFVGNIASPRLDISRAEVIEDLWSGEWLKFVDIEALTKLSETPETSIQSGR